MLQSQVIWIMRDSTLVPFSSSLCILASSNLLSIQRQIFLQCKSNGIFGTPASLASPPPPTPRGNDSLRWLMRPCLTWSTYPSSPSHTIPCPADFTPTTWPFSQLLIFATVPCTTGLCPLHSLCLDNSLCSYCTVVHHSSVSIEAFPDLPDQVKLPLIKGSLPNASPSQHLEWLQCIHGFCLFFKDLFEFQFVNTQCNISVRCTI